MTNTEAISLIAIYKNPEASEWQRQSAASQLIKSNERMYKKIIVSLLGPCSKEKMDEVLCVCFEAASKVIQNYKVGGAKFSSVVYTYCATEVKNTRRAKKFEYVNIDDEDECVESKAQLEYKENHAEQVIDKEASETIIDNIDDLILMAELSDRDEDILRRRYALGHSHQHSFEEIGELHGLGHHMIRKIVEYSRKRIYSIIKERGITMSDIMGI